MPPMLWPISTTLVYLILSAYGQKRGGDFPYPSSPDIRVVLHLAKQGACKVLDIENAVLLPPVCLVSEAIYPNILEVTISRKPVPRPIVVSASGLSPCLPRSTAETMNEYEIDKRFRDGAEKIESERTLTIFGEFGLVAEICTAAGARFTLTRGRGSSSEHHRGSE
jgi:hypothetical protein